MNQQQQNAIDFLTGIGLVGGDVDDLKIKKKKIMGSYDMDDWGYEGDFVIKTNKKGMIKSLAMSYEYDNTNLYAELKWNKMKQKKFEKALVNGHQDDLAYGMQLILSGNINGGFDEIESIPGAGDLMMTVWGNGQTLIF